MNIADVLVAAGVPQGTVKWMLCLVLSPVYCWGQGQVSATWLRHALSVLFGIGGSYHCFGLPATNLLVSAGGVYLIMILARPRCGLLSFIFSMVFLIYCHVAAASGGAWKEGNIDFTGTNVIRSVQDGYCNVGACKTDVEKGTQMVITARLTSIAFNYQDGIFADKDLTAHAIENKLLSLPNPLEYASYIFYPGSLLVGPWIPASAYFTYNKQEGVWAKGATRPSWVGPCLKAIGTAVICLGIHTTLLPMVPDTNFVTEWFQQKGLLWKIGYLYLMGIASRCKYYFVWKWAEAAVNAGGLGFSGIVDGKALWERGSNVSIRGVELAGSAADYPRQWNRCTGNWLRFYCYERIAPPGRRGLVSPFAALLITQLLSGFWHGLFAGYFLFFATSILMLQASKEIFRIQRTLPAGLPTIAGKAFHTLVSAFHLAYSAAVFVALFWEPSIACWRSLKFSGHISMLVLIAVGTALPKPRRAKGEKKAE